MSTLTISPQLESPWSGGISRSTLRMGVVAAEIADVGRAGSAR